MTASDIPHNADVIFVGGTTRWKWETGKYWCKNFTRVHIARVNSWQKLWLCKEWGAKSVDGTGWFRGKEERHDLHLFLIFDSGILNFEKTQYRYPKFPWVSPKVRRQLLKEFLNIEKPWNHLQEPLFWHH